MEKTTHNKFSQRHPLIFGFMMIITAVVIFMMAMAVFNFLFFSEQSKMRGKQVIGVVKVNGLITDSRDIVDWISELKRKDHIRGVVIRVNSPGGVVAPSQEIYAAVRDLALEKTVVVSMGAMATSGGYYLSSPAHKIVANPGTLTANIGVKATLTNMQELMRKIGIEDQAIYSSEYKDAGTVTRPMTDREKAYFQEIMDDLHEQFVLDVAAGRNMDVETVASLADGRAMTGRQALNNGLVDKLGGMNDAVDLVRELAEIKDQVFLLEGPEQKTSLLRRIVGEFSLRQEIFGPGWVFSYE
ncbi:signal peptide peptidase SppA [Desulfonatronovibrio magnus]|uniref:signal peptide peptidase SppA n=1 Tax=Desulfonatronovibrio magnus TaxID=698827 RepID=UPI0005EBEE1F|nr:signal peptide peptidase SppA [Desulfonatronovibrio magnus]